MDTFNDLYEFLQSYKENNIITWLEEPWVGKDKQESLLRIFAGLGLIDKLKKYDICKGNYNKKTIIKNTTIKDVFYNEENNVNSLKDKGDSSDLTGICKNNEKHLLVTTSKNLNKTQVGKLDIDKILTNFQQYKDEGYTMSLCICVRNSIAFKIMKKNIEQTNQQLKLLLEKEDTIIIDWNDLNQAYHQFKMFYGQTPLDNIINSNKTTLCLKMHQHLGVLKTLRMKNNEKKKILWGHIQRSGKSYIIGGCIIEDSKAKYECNYLVITTAPNETIEQQRKVFDCIQLTDFNIIVLNGKNKKPVLTKKNIIICSKQFLQTKMENHKITKTDIKRTIKKHCKRNGIKTKSKYTDSEIDTLINKYSITKKEILDDKPITKIKWLSEMSFDMRFIDESHNGGTTELAKKTLEFYGKQAFTVQITATYSKPINDYNIPKDCWILWDLEDIKLCKNITNEGSIIRLVEKHGDCIQDIISKYSQDSIISEYSKYPELWLLTDKINKDVVTEIINDTRDNNYGWSPDACFLLKQSIKKDKETHKSKMVIKEEFQNEGENLKLWYRIFGKKNKFGIPDKDYPDDIVFMKRIEKICKDPTIDSRFIGEGNFHNEPMIIMAFLPQNNIDKISKATIKLLERNNVIPDYEIISINSKTTNNPKQSIEDARIKARNSGKKGVLVLSGKQCSLGVSIINCDIVLLLNNSMGFDMIYQMMFRCMTEGENKKCGFVVDLNIHRVIETSVINYASLIKPELHPREATKFILQERLVNLNGDHWMPSFGNDVSKITALCENVYEMYSSNTENALNHFLNRLRFKEILLTKEEQKLFNAMFSNTTPTKIQKELIDTLLEKDDDDEKIKKGIEKTKVDNEEIDTSSETSNEYGKEDKQINYMDILKHIIPLLCILTIHDKKTSFVEMFELIENDDYVYNILIDQTKSWWGKSIDSKIIKKFINVYMKYMKDDKETNQIIRTVKELFMKNINNSKQLSELIDKYLEATELEKSGNAEIPTLFNLRQESLNKISCDFWKTPKKIIEPSCGKGGYIVDIIDKFMIGLKDVIPDEKERYKTIVEECIYFSDINPTNIFICKLLIDPYNEYKLNYNEGNTMELDITKTTKNWKGIDKFDLHVCNPPYEDNSSGKRKALNHNLWSEFLNWSYDRLNEDGLLLYITPTSWMSPTSKNKDIFYKSHILYLNVNECKKYFNVGSTFSYYVIKKTNIIGNTEVVCEYNKKIYKSICNLNGMEYLPKFTTNETINIIKKFMNNELPKVSFGTSCELHNTTHKNKLNDNKKDDYIYPVRHTTKRNIRYSTVKHTKQDEKKILINLSGNLNPIYDDETMGFTQAQMYLLTDKKEYVNILNSKLYKFVFAICKWSGFNIEKIYHNIPFITENKSDNEIYKIFNLTKEEIKIIEESI